MLGIFGSLYAAVAVLGIAAGVLSVGPLQFAEVNVLYVPGVSSEQGFTPPDPCVVDVAILDGQGNQAKFQEFSLEPGQSGHLSAAYGDLKGGAQAGGGVQEFSPCRRRCKTPVATTRIATRLFAQSHRRSKSSIARAG